MGTVVDNVVDGVILVDAHNIILAFNPACERLFGYTADEVIGRDVEILMPAEAGCPGFLDVAFRHGPSVSVADRGEAVGRRKGGATFPMDLSVDEARQKGRAIFVGVIHDLSDAERAAAVAREAVAQLRTVVDTVVDGVILTDAQGSVLMFNPACETLFGYRADEVVGRHIDMLAPLPVTERDSFLAGFPRAGTQRIVGTKRDIAGRRKDGSTFAIDLSVGEAPREGGSVFVCVVQDLTELKRIGAQLVQAQKMESVGQLTGGIAHDFNNLLTIIIGNAAFLADTLEAGSDQRHYATAIVTAGERGAELTRRLLAFARRQTPVPVEINCNELIVSMEPLLRRALRADVAIRTELAPGLWLTFTDPAQLESAILNLALNAKDAMPDGGCLTVATTNLPLDEHYRKTHPEAPSGQYIVISITDDGQGMAPEVVERVFEPFFTTKEIGKGSGLGLAMVYGFVRQSNGHITISSELGLGTTVRLYLPASSSEPANAIEEVVVPDEDLPRGDVTVLVAEDDPFVRAYAVSTLESLGYRVVAAVDGRDALRQLAQVDDIALLFSDIVMPGGMNGWELAVRALRLKPGLKILLTSGYDFETLAARGRLHPGTVVLSKPYRKADLAHRLHEALESVA